MNIKYTIDPKTPAEFIEPLMKATKMVEREVGNLAPRVSVDWEFLPHGMTDPRFRLLLSDSAGGSMIDEFHPSEITSPSLMAQEIHRFWERLLWDTAARQRERVGRMVEEYLAGVE